MIQFQVTHTTIAEVDLIADRLLVLDEVALVMDDEVVDEVEEVGNLHCCICENH